MTKIITTILLSVFTFSVFAADVSEQYVFKKKQDKISQIETKLKGFEKQKKVKLHGKDKDLQKIGAEVITITDEDVLNDLQNDPNFEYFEKDGPFEPAFTPNDPIYANMWHLQKMQLPTAWDYSKGATNLIIAIMDGGVYNQNPDLINKVLSGYNAYSSTTTGGGYGNNAHATMCAGFSGAQGNNGVGVVAPAFNSKLMSIIVTDSAGSGYASAISRGIIWGADHGVKITTTSFKVFNSFTVINASKYLYDKGGLSFVAAGNDGAVQTGTDSKYVVVVMSTDSADKKASFSNWGAAVDIAAPGVNMWSTSGGGYAAGSGTSYSTPTAASVAAVVWGANPLLRNYEIEGILKVTAIDCGPMPGMTNRILRIDAKNAVQRALYGTATLKTVTNLTVP